MKRLLFAIVLAIAIPFNANAQWTYQDIEEEGMSRVKDSNGKWGYLDQTGKLVIPCKWKFAYDFHEGMAVVEDDNVILIKLVS